MNIQTRSGAGRAQRPPSLVEANVTLRLVVAAAVLLSLSSCTRRLPCSEIDQLAGQEWLGGVWASASHGKGNPGLRAVAMDLTYLLADARNAPPHADAVPDGDAVIRAASRSLYEKAIRPKTEGMASVTSKPLLNTEVAAAFVGAAEEAGISEAVATKIWAENKYHLGAAVLHETRPGLSKDEQDVLSRSMSASTQCRESTVAAVSCATIIEILLEAARRVQRLALDRERSCGGATGRNTEDCGRIEDARLANLELTAELDARKKSVCR